MVREFPRRLSEGFVSGHTGAIQGRRRKKPDHASLSRLAAGTRQRIKRAPACPRTGPAEERVGVEKEVEAEEVLLAKAPPARVNKRERGAWRSLACAPEWVQEVAGSNPVAPTFSETSPSAKTSRGFLCQIYAPRNQFYQSAASAGYLLAIGTICSQN